MGLVFKVGDGISGVPPVPKNFPKCGSWSPEPIQDLQSKVREWTNNSSININLIQSSNNDPYQSEYNLINSSPNTFSISVQIIAGVYIIAILL